MVRYETKSNRAKGETRHWRWSKARLARKLFPVPTRLRNFYGVVPVWFSTMCSGGVPWLLLLIESWAIYLREIGWIGKKKKKKNWRRLCHDFESVGELLLLFDAIWTNNYVCASYYSLEREKKKNWRYRILTFFKRLTSYLSRNEVSFSDKCHKLLPWLIHSSNSIYPHICFVRKKNLGYDKQL